MIRRRPLLALLAAAAAGLPPLPARAARDTLTIGLTQYPATLNPMIDAMLAKSYVLGATQRQLTFEGHACTPVSQLCVKLHTREAGAAERFPSQTDAGRHAAGVRRHSYQRDPYGWGAGVLVSQ